MCIKASFLHYFGIKLNYIVPFSFLKQYLILSILCLSSLGYGQNKLTLKKGIVMDSLSVPSTKGMFSVYLPKTFDTSKSWPLLLGFDSSGKTGGITRLYKAAAEEYGYIVVIADVLEHQKPKEKVEYMLTFMDYVHSLFSIQKRRVYVTAFGDDAKIVSLLPALYSDEIAGVIAIGDSYYYNSSVRIKKSFSYLGVVNTSNYRYRDFFNNKAYLKSKAIPADVFVYNDTSKLPNQRIINKALSTFTLQAMLKGRIPKDSIRVQRLFKKDLAEVDSYIGKGEFLFANEELKRIRIKYGMFFNTSYLKEEQKEIKKRKEYKREKRLESKYNYKERLIREKYMFALEEDVEIEDFENLGWWKYQMSLVDTLVQNKEKYAHDTGLRAKGYLKYLVDAYKAELLKDNNKYLVKRLFLNILSTIVDEQDFESYKKIISLSAQDQDYETALFYLEKMLQNGYKDVDALYVIEGTLALKLSKEYNELIKKYLGTSKYLFSN